MTIVRPTSKSIIRTGGPRGFTVMEVLVCIAIIGVLLTLVLPAVQKARESACLVDCKNRLRQIGLASHHFHDAHRAFPRMRESLRGLMPYLDLQSMHDMMAESEKKPPLTSGDFSSIGTAPVFACPSGDVDPAVQEVSFVLNTGTRLDPYYRGVDSNGMMFVNFRLKNQIRLSNVTDGASNTAFWSETLAWQRYVIGSKETEHGLYWRQIAERPNSMLDLQRLCRTAEGRHEGGQIDPYVTGYQSLSTYHSSEFAALCMGLGTTLRHRQ